MDDVRRSMVDKSLALRHGAQLAIVEAVPRSSAIRAYKPMTFEPDAGKVF